MKTCHRLLHWFPVNSSRGFDCPIVQSFLPGCILLRSWIEQKPLETTHFMLVSFLHPLGCLKRLVVIQSSYVLYWGFFPLWILHVIKRNWTDRCFPTWLTQISFLSSVSMFRFVRVQKEKKIKWGIFHIAVPYGISLVNTYLCIWKLLIEHIHQISVHGAPFVWKDFLSAYTYGFCPVWVLLYHRKDSNQWRFSHIRYTICCLVWIQTALRMTEGFLLSLHLHLCPRSWYS